MSVVNVLILAALDTWWRLRRRRLRTFIVFDETWLVLLSPFQFAVNKYPQVLERWYPVQGGVFNTVYVKLRGDFWTFPYTEVQ